ncbi:hypothetical protein [Commensalibacter oyaizuii]|uniref:Uncharacterized protein n=1 Tax=Commensalibacter oyaizuii TaxID=3043873 RepID=A0ABT6Q3H1_9PROT|nr:hypothetical protein [Commensalibacter sp. TBRC 16381]MDI2091666.1 hypothetical protein [Commensalibacter sp. TBRC 16381]
MAKKVTLIAFLGVLINGAVQAKSLYVGQEGQKPIEVAINFLRDVLPSGDEEGYLISSLEYKRIFCKKLEICPLQGQVIFTLDGLNDDSIVKKRYILLLEQDVNQRWSVIKKDVDQACRKGRGHLNFSKKPCQ